MNPDREEVLFALALEKPAVSHNGLLGKNYVTKIDDQSDNKLHNVVKSFDGVEKVVPKGRFCQRLQPEFLK